MATIVPGDKEGNSKGGKGDGNSDEVAGNKECDYKHGKGNSDGNYNRRQQGDGKVGKGGGYGKCNHDGGG